MEPVVEVDKRMRAGGKEAELDQQREEPVRRFPEWVLQPWCVLKQRSIGAGQVAQESGFAHTGQTGKLERMGRWQADLLQGELGYGKTDWEGLISASLREEAIQAMAGIDLLSLCSVWGLQELKRTLGTRLSERVQPMGVIVVPHSGVMVQGLRPTDAVREVLIQGYAAATLGAATLARVRPILSELEQGDLDNAWNALLLAWGASIVQGASPPSVVVSAAGNGHGPLPDGVRELLGQGPARPGTHPTRGAATGAEKTPT